MRLIDANEIENLFNAQVERGATDLFDAFEDALQDAQAVDAVVVARCENCAFSQSNGWVCGGTALMPQHRTFPNSFCSYGERMAKP